MKNKIIYILIFTGAFILVTGGFIYLNSLYQNIFEFNFKPAEYVQDSISVKQNETKNLASNEAKKNDIKNNEAVEEVQDSIKSMINEEDRKAAEKEKTEVKKEQPVEETPLKETVQSEIKPEPVSNFTSDSFTRVDNFTEEETEPEVDSLYIIWTKKTAKMYEAMDADKAAKIIVNYSDNIAKDIIYSMKRKKAAEILANLNPETASRITRAKNGF